MNYHLLLSFAPLVLIFLLSLSLFSILSRFLKNKTFFLLLSVFLASPLLIGLLLYLIFFVAPNQAKIFYIIAISFPILLLTFLGRKNLFLAFQVISDKWRILVSKPLDLFSKIILFAILFALILVFLRTILWPINWVDQIYYIKQAYVFAQTRSLDLFFKWGFFHDSSLYSYQMNPAIRPGLPMVFSTTFLFNNSLRDAQYFCQTIIFYYFLLTSSVVFYVSWKIAKKDNLKSALIALFLMLFTFHFIYLSIGGFKELIIIPMTILILFYISNQEKLLGRLNPCIYIGIFAGLMSFINYSGVLISLFVLLIFILTKGISPRKIISATKILLFVVIFSGFEFFVFINFVAPSLASQFFHKEVASTTEQPIDVATSNTENDFIAAASPAAKNEFAGYGITSLKDLYIKGKFQGLFQIQYFGLIFILFTIIVIATYKRLLENRFIKNLLFFLLIYGFIFFDPLNINRNDFAYVLSISQKYTTLLVPFVAIVIAYQFNRIEKLLEKINPKGLIVILSSFSILDFIFLKNNPERLLKIISVFVPILNNREYYIRGLRLLNNMSLILSTALLITLTYFYMMKRKKLVFLFRKTSMVSGFFLLIFFLSPFLFFYNSNFGLKNTFAYSFDNNSVKLGKIIGWEEMYSPLKDLNELPQNKKILVIDQPISLIDIYLNLPMENIYDLSKLPDQKDISAIRKLGISYIYARANSKLGTINISDIDDLKKVEQLGGNLILEVKP